MNISFARILKIYYTMSIISFSHSFLHQVKGMSPTKKAMRICFFACATDVRANSGISHIEERSRRCPLLTELSET